MTTTTTNTAETVNTATDNIDKVMATVTTPKSTTPKSTTPKSTTPKSTTPKSRKTDEDLPKVEKSLIILSQQRKARVTETLQSSKIDFDTNLLDGVPVSMDIDYTIPQLVSIENEFGYNATTLQVKLGDTLIRIRIIGKTESLGNDVPGSVFLEGYVLASAENNIYRIVGRITNGLAKFLSQEAIDDLTKPTAKYMGCNKDTVIKTVTDNLKAKELTNKTKGQKALSAYGSRK